MSTSVRVAVVQAGTIPFDAAAATDRATERLAEVSRQDAVLAVFPEAFIGGYPKGLDFGICVGRRTTEGREDFRRYHAGSIPVPGEQTDKLAAACRTHNMHAVVGVIERDGGTLYCTSLYLGPGKLLGSTAKSCLQAQSG